ncbi:MAG TPA: transporter substrate-binding domain-containing protein [Flavobacteriales bacterium]|nr:transporter substrate-binding domain-containing protein [Flavobacteriales bacterium]
MPIRFLPTPIRLCVLLLAAFPCMAALAHQEPAKELHVGLAGAPPFLFTDNSGIAMDIWQATADRLDINFAATTYASMPLAMDALASGEVDARAIGS